MDSIPPAAQVQKPRVDRPEQIVKEEVEEDPEEVAARKWKDPLALRKKAQNKHPKNFEPLPLF